MLAPTLVDRSMFPLTQDRGFEEIPRRFFRSGSGRREASAVRSQGLARYVHSEHGQSGVGRGVTIGATWSIRNKLDLKLYGQYAASPKMQSNTPDPRSRNVLVLA